MKWVNNTVYNEVKNTEKLTLFLFWIPYWAELAGSLYSVAAYLLHSVAGKVPPGLPFDLFRTKYNGRSNVGGGIKNFNVQFIIQLSWFYYTFFIFKRIPAKIIIIMLNWIHSQCDQTEIIRYLFSSRNLAHNLLLKMIYISA